MPDDPKLAAGSSVPGAAELDLPADRWRLPISLRIIAFIFTLLGILSTVDMILSWWMLSQIHINFVCLFVLIGWGLRRWSEASRGWAIFLTTAALLLYLIWLPSVLYVLFGGELPANVSVGGASLKGLLIGGGLLAFLVWQRRVLRRPDIVWRFENRHLASTLGGRDCSARSSHGWRFSLESLFLSTIVVAFAIVDVQSHELWWSDQYCTATSRSPDGREMRRADYVLAKPRFFDRPDQLRYLVLTRGDEVGHGISSRSHNSEAVLTVHVPDGKAIEVAGNHQLYELDHGLLRFSDERVANVEFEDYLKSKPVEWSVEALVQHAKQRRAKMVDANATSAMPQ